MNKRELLYNKFGGRCAYSGTLLEAVRGYAYEHRVVAEGKIKRPLLPGEVVHHIDGNKLNNSEENLHISKSIRHHLFFHRLKNIKRISPEEENVMVECLCGCGKKFFKYDDYGRLRLYVSGHNPQKNDTEKLVIDLVKHGTYNLYDIVKISKKSKSSISCCVLRLLKKGKLEKISRGIYAKK